MFSENLSALHASELRLSQYTNLEGKEIPRGETRLLSLCIPRPLHNPFVQHERSTVTRYMGCQLRADPRIVVMVSEVLCPMRLSLALCIPRYMARAETGASSYSDDLETGNRCHQNCGRIKEGRTRSTPP